MLDPAGKAKNEALRLDFDRRLMLQFRGSVITSDGGLLAYRELDDVLALTTTGGERLAEARTGKNRRHLLVGLLRQSVRSPDLFDLQRSRRQRTKQFSLIPGLLQPCRRSTTSARIWSLKSNSSSSTTMSCGAENSNPWLQPGRVQRRN